MLLIVFANRPPMPVQLSPLVPDRPRSFPLPPNPHFDARFAERDLVARLETQSARAARDDDAAAAADDAGALRAVVVEEARALRVGIELDACVTPRYGPVDLFITLGERDMVDAEELMATVSHVRASADRDREGGER